jgi:adenosylhomocysteine nucleosidase
VRKYMSDDLTFRGGFYYDARVAFAQCGMGQSAAQKGTRALLDAHAPHWVLSAGFSGALVPDLRIGDIVVGQSLVDETGQELKLDLKMADDPKRGLRVGRLLTVDRIVRTVAEKRELAERHQALAVDMESYVVAEMCREAKVRFMAVRVISDDLSADLSPEILTMVGPSGAVRLGAALGALWKRPGSVKEMWRLREQANMASERLALFLGGVITQLYEASQ